MSVAALHSGASAPSWLRRAAVATLALALVVAAGALLAWLVLPAAPPPPARNPFGIGMREAAPAATGLAARILAWQAAFFVQLRGALSALKESGSAWPLLLGLGFGYGIFHAAGPGHGKAIVAGYIVANGRALRTGLAISTAAALVQALVAIGLVTIVFRVAGGTAALMSRTAQGVELAGFALVCLVGAGLLWRKAGAFLARLDPSLAIAGGCSESCGHLHGPAPAGTRWRDGVGVALAAGIRPCAGAIVVLTFAAAQGLYPAGIAAVAAMAAGTAITTGLIAALAVYAKRAALALAGGRGRMAGLGQAGAELLAAAAILAIGAALLLGSWGSGI